MQADEGHADAAANGDTSDDGFPLENSDGARSAAHVNMEARSRCGHNSK